MKDKARDNNKILYIADKFFAISTNSSAFTNWLNESCADFLIEGNPHALINLDFNMVHKSSLQPGTSFSIIPACDNNGVNFRVTISEPDDPEHTFRMLLNACLQCTVMLKQLPVIWMHASGVLYGNQAYVFTGPSGTGKSTVCNILDGEPGFTILHDEIVTLSQTGDGFHAWSSPLRGERPASCRQGGPLRAIFTLKHAEENSIMRISGRKAPALLAANLLRIAKASNDGLTSQERQSVELLLALSEKVPCHELRFRPDFSFWASIEQFLENEPVISTMKA